MHDVAIVGQGPAGGIAALRLAEAGHSVVTFERKKRERKERFEAWSDG